jgi:peptidoglycan/xylan/chitin deacetylase (PgdA/CDA1 family)
MYHYIRVNPSASDSLGFSLSVTPADFGRQMDYLRANGFHALSMGDVVDAMEIGRPLPPRSVVLTFDDGYSDFATAAVPIIVAHGFTATTYAVPGFLGRPGYMTTSQLQQAATLHMVVAAHTVHHVDLPRLGEAAAWAEIADSRHQLQQLTGQPVNDFAYPYGHFNSLDANLVQRAGFRDAVTTYPGTLHTLGQRFLLPRVRVSGGETLDQFAASVGVPMQAPPAPPSPAAPSRASAPSATFTSNANESHAPAQPPGSQPAGAVPRLPSINDELRTSWVPGSRMRTF